MKGHGGALLCEKLVASASRYRVILVDATKVVPALGDSRAIPVEIETFGWRHTTTRLAAPGCRVVRCMLASAPDAAPFITDGGHYILDLFFDSAPTSPRW